MLEISPQQLEALSAGRSLKAEVMGAQQGREGVSKKAVKALRDELMNSGTALPIVLLIAQVLVCFIC